MSEEYPIAPHALKGRGVAYRQAHRFERDQRTAFDDGWGTVSAQQAAGEEVVLPATQVRDVYNDMLASVKRAGAGFRDPAGRQAQYCRRAAQ